MHTKTVIRGSDLKDDADEDDADNMESNDDNGEMEDTLWIKSLIFICIFLSSIIYFQIQTFWGATTNTLCYNSQSFSIKTF